MEFLMMLGYLGLVFTGLGVAKWGLDKIDPFSSPIVTILYLGVVGVSAVVAIGNLVNL